MDISKKDITIELIEAAGYKIYAGTDEYPKGRVWSGPREWITGQHNAKVSHSGKFLKLLKHNAGYYMVYLAVAGKRYAFLVHRLITMKYLNIKPTQQVDHYDHDRANNRLNNLRVVTAQQNQFNQSNTKGFSSKYKGVTFFKRDRKWQARIGYNGKTTHLGLFDTEVRAAKAYDKAARRLFGEYKNLNFSSISGG